MERAPRPDDWKDSGVQFPHGTTAGAATREEEPVAKPIGEETTRSAIRERTFRPCLAWRTKALVSEPAIGSDATLVAALCLLPNVALAACADLSRSLLPIACQFGAGMSGTSVSGLCPVADCLGRLRPGFRRGVDRAT
jgi:hypothetical protein